MEFTIVLGAGDRVDATSDDGVTITTDQHRPAVSPFELFLASIGTCAGFYISNFCRRRNIPVDGISIRQRLEVDTGSGMVTGVVIEVGLPPSFPGQYREAVLRSAQACTVKKHLEHPPSIEVRAV